jgi:hypothetical protein
MPFFNPLLITVIALLSICNSQTVAYVFSSNTRKKQRNEKHTLND